MNIIGFLTNDNDIVAMFQHSSNRYGRFAHSEIMRNHGEFLFVCLLALQRPGKLKLHFPDSLVPGDLTMI